jgi:hypothetical protein
VFLFAGVFHVWRTGLPPLSATSRLEATGHRAFVVLPFGGPLLVDADVRSHLLGLPIPSVVSDRWLRTISASIARDSTTVTCDHPPCETAAKAGSLASVADAFVYLGS